MNRVISRAHFKIVEKYVFLGELRYRVQIVGTNVVFNVRADSDEEAIDKACKLAERIGLSDEHVESIRNKYKALGE